MLTRTVRGASVAAIALTAGSLFAAAPAEAQWRRHHGGWGHGGGAVAAGVIGGLALGALASGAFARPAYGYSYDYGYAPAASYGYGYRQAYPTSGFMYDASPGYGYYQAAPVYRRARPLYVTERRYYRNNPSLYNYGPRYASGYGCRVVTRRTPIDPWTYQVRRVRICG